MLERFNESGDRFTDWIPFRAWIDNSAVLITAIQRIIFLGVLTGCSLDPDLKRWGTMNAQRFLFSFVGLIVFSLGAVAKAEVDDRVFELRTYYANEGKLDLLLARFRDHTIALFEKHGMENIGYWVPQENSENKLVYVLAFPNREASSRSWEAFIADPEWKAAYQASIVDGQLVDRIERKFMTMTVYSSELKLVASDPSRVFELRIYTTEEGRLPNLDARFKDHTIRLFERHGMENLVYWHLMDDQEGAVNTLVYLLAHANGEAARESWKGFRNDPDWESAFTASKEAAGGRLVVKGGVDSIYLEPVDFSPMK